MKKLKEIEGRKCPKCGKVEMQKNAGFTKAGSQRCKCLDCNYTYTLNPKPHAYSEEVKMMALRVYYSGVSGRGVGKVFGMNKANVYNWIKKTGNSVDKSED